MSPLYIRHIYFNISRRQINIYILQNIRGPHLLQGGGGKRVKQHGRFFTSSLASVFKQILHYFTMFDQCFNKRHFLIEISVNLIIIAGFERPQKGWGGGGGGYGWIAFLMALLQSFNRIMTQLACFTDFKCLKSLKYTYSDFRPENDVSSQQCWSEDC